MRLIADTKYDVRAPQFGLRGKLRDDHVSPTGGPLQAARGQVRGEHALDYGCVSREWLFLLTRNVQPELRPVRVIVARQLHATDQLDLGRELGALYYFKFIGRILALPYSIIGFFFVLNFYKMVLNKKVNLNDLETGDYELYKALPGCCACSSSWSWCWLMPLFVTRRAYAQQDVLRDQRPRWQARRRRTRPGGAAQDVTEANKEDADLVVGTGLQSGSRSSSAHLWRGSGTCCC